MHHKPDVTVIFIHLQCSVPLKPVQVVVNSHFSLTSWCLQRKFSHLDQELIQ